MYRIIGAGDRNDAFGDVDHRLHARMSRRHHQHWRTLGRDLPDDAGQPIRTHDHRPSRRDHVGQPVSWRVDRCPIDVDNVVLKPDVTSFVGRTSQGEDRVESRSDHQHDVVELVACEVTSESSFWPQPDSGESSPLIIGGVGEDRETPGVRRPRTREFGCRASSLIDVVGPRSHHGDGGANRRHDVRPSAGARRRLSVRRSVPRSP